MGNNIFVSYKYYDSNVYPVANISYLGNAKARDYVTWIENELTKHSNHIYKGEHDGEDLSDKSEEYIWSVLKDKMYDSTLTIVLISPNMKETGKWEINQWIPWEIAYSLRETTRNDRTSHSNAILAVVLPDKNGNYGYFDNMNLFSILRKNINNGYISVVKWNLFKLNYDKYIYNAYLAKEITPKKDVVKTI